MSRRAESAERCPARRAPSKPALPSLPHASLLFEVAAVWAQQVGPSSFRNPALPAPGTRPGPREGLGECGGRRGEGEG